MSGVLVDAVVVGFIGYSTWRGWKRGLVRGVTKIMGLVAAALVAVVLRAPLAAMARSVGVPDGYDDLVGAGLAFVGILVAFRFFGDAISKALRTTKIGSLVDGGGGAALSGIWSFVLTAIVLVSISLFDSSPLAEAVENSEVGSAVVRAAPDLAGADVRGFLQDLLRPRGGS